MYFMEPHSQSSWQGESSYGHARAKSSGTVPWRCTADAADACAKGRLQGTRSKGRYLIWGNALDNLRLGLAAKNIDIVARTRTSCRPPSVLSSGGNAIRHEWQRTTRHHGQQTQARSPSLGGLHGSEGSTTCLLSEARASMPRLGWSLEVGEALRRSMRQC